MNQPVLRGGLPGVLDPLRRDTDSRRHRDTHQCGSAAGHCTSRSLLFINGRRVSPEPACWHDDEANEIGAVSIRAGVVLADWFCYKTERVGGILRESELAEADRKLEEFIKYRDGGPIVGMNKPMQRRWEKIVETAKAPDVTPHDLRRTFTTRLIRAGVPLPTVQKLAGHADIKNPFLKGGDGIRTHE